MEEKLMTNDILKSMLEMERDLTQQKCNCLMELDRLAHELEKILWWMEYADPKQVQAIRQEIRDEEQ